MTRRGILTGGTMCIDRNFLVDNWPRENGRAHVLDIVVSGGGSACNLAVAMRKLAPDLPISTNGIVGDDEDGRYLLNHADANNIGRDQITVAKNTITDQTWAFSAMPSGQRTHISRFGSSDALTPDHFDFSAASEKIFHLGLPGVHKLMDAPWRDDPSGWVTVLKEARKAGLKTNLELVSLTPEELIGLIRPCLPYLDTLVVNDAEIGAISNTSVVSDGHTDPAAATRAAKWALDAGAMDIVVVHFPNGAIAVTRDGSVVNRPSLNVPPDQIKGANGAGDAFAAGFLYGKHENWELGETLSLAHATAATSLRSISTTASVEPWSVCLEFANSWGWRDTLE
jgi:sugar/nucleoside kinase (ribokinase family)